MFYVFTFAFIHINVQSHKKLSFNVTELEISWQTETNRPLSVDKRAWRLDVLNDLLEHLRQIGFSGVGGNEKIN